MIKRNELKNFTIETKEDVKAFASYIIDDLGCCFNPDDSFTDLIYTETKEQVFDSESASYLDNISEACFEVVGEEFYEITLNILEKYFTREGVDDEFIS